MVAFFLAFCNGYAQQYNLISATPIPSPELSSVDLTEHIYIKSANGKILKYNIQGQKLYEYEDSNTQFVSFIDASSPLRLLAFYQSRQSYQYYDRVLTPSALISLESDRNGQYTICAASADNNIWLWEPSLLKLQRFNPILGTVSLDVSARFYLNEGGEIIQVKEYRNNLYLNNRDQEILVFDILGNYLKKLPVATSADIQFYGNELYWFNGRLIEKYDISTMQRTKMTLPKDLPTDDTIHSLYLRDKRLIVVLEDQLLIYKIAG